MKKKLLAAIFGCLMIFDVSILLADSEGDGLSQGRYTHTIKPEYLYSTGQVEQKNTKDKRVWDYLSFLAIETDPDNGHIFKAEEATELRARVRELGRQLLGNARESIAEEYAITINTFVNLDSLYKTSSFGRYIAEQLIGEMQLAGVDVIDVRKSAGLMIYEKHGEYGLSRDMNELSYLHNTQAMVVGTYTFAQGQVFINARLLQNSDGLVLSNASMVFDLDPVTRQMLSNESMPARRGRVVKVEKFVE